MLLILNVYKNSIIHKYSFLIKKEINLLIKSCNNNKYIYIYILYK